MYFLRVFVCLSPRKIVNTAERLRNVTHCSDLTLFFGRLLSIEVKLLNHNLSFDKMLTDAHDTPDQPNLACQVMVVM